MGRPWKEGALDPGYSECCLTLAELEDLQPTMHPSQWDILLSGQWGETGGFDGNLPGIKRIESILYPEPRVWERGHQSNLMSFSHYRRVRLKRSPCAVPGESRGQEPTGVLDVYRREDLGAKRKRQAVQESLADLVRR